MRRRPWLVPISSLKQGQNQLGFELGIEELGGTEHEVTENPSFQELVGPIRVELDIFRDGGRLLIRGAVSFEARFLCALCAEGFSRQFREQLAAEYADARERAQPKSGVLDAAEMDRVILDGDFVNLGPAVRDLIHLAIPIAPCCRPDCKGVCPVCGASLNLGPCRCRAAES